MHAPAHTTHRWRQQERQSKLEAAQQEEEAQRATEAKRVSELQAISREEERRQAEVEAKRVALKEEREVAAARLKMGEFRYVDDYGGQRVFVLPG